MSYHVSGSREDESWFSGEQLRGVMRADDADELRSPIPTSMVSNGEYVPLPQTAQQREVEARLADLADGASKKLGMSRRRFLSTSGGMAAAFLAMNQTFGHYFDVDPAEMYEPAAAAELGVPRDVFVFDDQLHMIRDSALRNGIALRALAQGPGPGSATAGITKNPYNELGYPDELGNPWTPWTDSLAQTPDVHADFTLVQFVKDVFLDSQVTVGHLTNAPLGLFVPPGESKGIIPRTVNEALDGCNLTGYQTAMVRDFVNKIAGSQRLLAHGQLFPGKANVAFMQKQIDQFHPDSWKGYSVAYCAKTDDDPTEPMKRWRMDDEDVAYPMYEVIRRNRQELAQHPGFFNICVHKGLQTNTPSAQPDDRPENGNPDDIPKAAKDWPEFNFIIYHAAWAPQFFGYPTLQDIKAGRMRNGVPDIQWTTRMAQDCAHLPNVYTEMGTTFGAVVTTFPTVAAHLVGQLLKYWGSKRVVFGTDSLWYGSPQWQIEALWRFQIPDAIASKFGYPQLTPQMKREILGLNSARIYKLKPSAPVSPAGIYKPVPRDYVALIPETLKRTLHDDPGFKGYGYELPHDRLAKLKSDYEAAGGRRENLRYGWVRRA
jgi:predicted TIM-barrel fold metal-dependent hydrolase